jgi:hypothetical protein
MTGDLMKDIFYRTAKFSAIQGVLLAVFVLLMGGQGAIFALFIMLGMGMAHFSGSMAAANLILNEYGLAEKLKDGDKK